MSDYKAIPPKLATRLLTWLIRDELAEEVLGDLEEKFYAVAEKKSLTKAKLNYWYQVLNYLRPFSIGKPKQNGLSQYEIYRSYFKVGCRSLLRNKGYSSINIGGLAIGLTVTVLIGLWIHDELTFDQYHTHYDRIAQVMQHNSRNGQKSTLQNIPYPLGEELRSSYGSDFNYVVMSSYTISQILSFGDAKIKRSGTYMETDALRLLSLKMLKGNYDALRDMNSVVLASSTAKALFGDKDPVGKVIRIKNQLNATVTGVYQDPPYNSTFSDLMFIAPWDLFVSSLPFVQRSRDLKLWDDNSYKLYVQLADGVVFQEVNEKIRLVKYNSAPELQGISDPEIFLHPMKDWHLRSNWKNGTKAGGRIQYVWNFGAIAAFVLVLACINFMNLSTAHSEHRAREVGIRKTIGSTKRQLISQFLCESMLVVLLAFLIAMLLVFLLIPWFNQIADKEIAAPFGYLDFWLVSLGFILLITLLSGSYPAFFLSSFRPIHVLKGIIAKGRYSTSLRKVLVVIQFTVSIILIIGTIAVERQIQHTRNRSLGYDNSGLITVPVAGMNYFGKYEILRNELKSRDAIVEMTQSTGSMTQLEGTSAGFTWEGKDTSFNPVLAPISVTPDYGQTISWKMTKGRDFSREFATDSSSFILDETAVKYLGFEDPLGKTIRWLNQDFTVIGVVKDIVRESPFSPVLPTVYTIGPEIFATDFTLKLNPEKPTQESLAIIEEVFTGIAPEVPFDFTFVDREYTKKFRREERIGNLSGIFAALAIMISGMGLFGLASYVAEQRTKEIGIRKVLGASVIAIWRMLSNEVVLLVIIASVLAIPTANYFINGWLKNYEYRTQASWWIFAGAGAGVLVLALMIVSFKAIKAATANPVNSLRSE